MSDVTDLGELAAADALACARSLVRDAVSVVALTGAGVSAESGVPTFRGSGGLWKQYRAEDLATPQAFARDPRLVWEWYDWRRRLIADCRPNRAHEVLAAWSSRLPHFTLITQNVDGLHEAAGSRHVVRLHGSIWHLRCATPCDAGRGGWRDDRTPLEPLPPACPHCGAVARPAVVWFGEALEGPVLDAATAACTADLFFAVGTSAVVHPAAGLLYEAKRRHAFVVEINPDVTEATDLVDVALTGPAEAVLDALESKLEMGTG